MSLTSEHENEPILSPLGWLVLIVAWAGAYYCYSEVGMEAVRGDLPGWGTAEWLSVSCIILSWGGFKVFDWLERPSLKTRANVCLVATIYVWGSIVLILSWGLRDGMELVEIIMGFVSSAVEGHMRSPNFLLFLGAYGFYGAWQTYAQEARWQAQKSEKKRVEREEAAATRAAKQRIIKRKRSLKECPMCAEEVKVRAKICRYCRHTF